MKKILFVDDEKCVRDTWGAMLECRGFQVVTAQNGREALRLLAEQPVDLIIIDIIMPDMEGVETILKLRREDEAIPIIAMSGGGLIASDDYLRLAKGAGVNSTLNKPFTLGELLDAIDEVVTPPPRTNSPTQFINPIAQLMQG